MPGNSDQLTVINNSINALNQTIGNLYTLLQTFPRTTGTSSAGPTVAGSIVFTSSEATGFLLIQSSSGATVKVPYYSNP